MAFFVKFEDKDTLDWITAILSNTVKRMGQGVSADSKLIGQEDKILRAYDAVSGYVTEKNLNDLGINVVKEPKPENTDVIHCSYHPKYGAKRSPGTACEGCWAAYKKYHPLEYDMARAKWEKKQPTTTVKAETTPKLKAAVKK